MRRKNQAERRHQLARAAREVLLERGAVGVRVKDVAERAGLAPSSVLYYYPSLDELLIEVSRGAIERFTERLLLRPPGRSVRVHPRRGRARRRLRARRRRPDDRPRTSIAPIDAATTPPLTERFTRALGLAFELHAGQSRKGSGVPYFGHLLGVTAIVIETGASEDEAIAALLHDAAEDQGGRETLERIRAEFGGPVAEIVESCSDSFGEPKPPWRERKRAYLEHLEDATDPALHVSLADKLHNVRTIVVDYRDLGEGLWERFNAERDEVLAYYRALAGIFSRRMPGALATELSATVAELDALVAAVSPASASPKNQGM